MISLLAYHAIKARLINIFPCQRFVLSHDARTTKERTVDSKYVEFGASDGVCSDIVQDNMQQVKPTRRW